MAASGKRRCPAFTSSSFFQRNLCPEYTSGPQNAKIIADRLRIYRLVGDEKASCDCDVGGADAYGNKTTPLPPPPSAGGVFFPSSGPAINPFLTPSFFSRT